MPFFILRFIFCLKFSVIYVYIPVFFILLMCTRTKSSSFRYKRYFFVDLINHFKSVKRRTDIIKTREYMYQFWIISFAFRVIFLSVFASLYFEFSRPDLISLGWSIYLLFFSLQNNLICCKCKKHEGIKLIRNACPIDDMKF